MDESYAFRRSFEALGVLADIPPYAVAELEAASHGFPQHVNGYLTVPRKAIEKHGRAALDAAVQHGALTLDRHNALSFGVPSFHAFVQWMLEDKEKDVW